MVMGWKWQGRSTLGWGWELLECARGKDTEQEEDLCAATGQYLLVHLIGPDVMAALMFCLLNLAGRWSAARRQRMRAGRHRPS